MAGWPGWEHLGTAVRIESEVLDARGQRVPYENRFYVSSLARQPDRRPDAPDSRPPGGSAFRGGRHRTGRTKVASRGHGEGGGGSANTIEKAYGMTPLLCFNQAAIPG